MLVLLSLLGFFFALHRFRRDLHPAFYPAVTVSLISVLVCVGGIFGALSQTAAVLRWLGVACFLGFGAFYFRMAWKTRDWEEIRSFSRLFLCFSALLAVSALLLRDHFLYSYDDFSHWGLVTRVLLTESRFPLPQDDLMFPSYPPGSACFLYFCAQPGEPLGLSLLFSQALMLISFFFSLQAGAGGKGKGCALITLFIFLLLFYNIHPDTLSVDNLLGACFFSALLLPCVHRERMQKHMAEEGVLLSCCLLIKNSGLLLSLGVILLLLIFEIRRSRKIHHGILWLLLPLLVYALWRFHLRQHFTDFGKHYMSLRVYWQTIRGRLGDLGMFFSILLPVVVSPLRNHALWLIPAFACLYFATPPSERRETGRMGRICGGMLLLYEAGIIGMYLSSMGMGELASQSGGDFVRYNGTMIVALMGLLVVRAGEVARGMNRAGAKGGPAWVAAALGLVVLTLSMNMTRLVDPVEARKLYPDAGAFSEMAREQDIPENQDVAVLIGDAEATGYHEYMANYYLRHERSVSVYGAEQAPEEKDLPEGTLVIDLRAKEMYTR